VSRNSLSYGIRVYRHPRLFATNCGEQTVVLYRGLTVNNSKCPDVRSPSYDPGNYYPYEKIVSIKFVRLTTANSVYYSVSLKIYCFTKKSCNRLPSLSTQSHFLRVIPVLLTVQEFVHSKTHFFSTLSESERCTIPSNK
jgi:hypothetical protein